MGAILKKFALGYDQVRITYNPARHEVFQFGTVGEIRVFEYDHSYGRIFFSISGFNDIFEDWKNNDNLILYDVLCSYIHYIHFWHMEGMDLYPTNFNNREEAENRFKFNLLMRSPEFDTGDYNLDNERITELIRGNEFPPTTDFLWIPGHPRDSNDYGSVNDQFDPDKDYSEFWDLDKPLFEYNFA